MYEKIITYLKEQISLNECIILPNFGGFETEYSPSIFDKSSGKIIPPHKKIKFIEEYKKDNGYLANYIAQKENCSRDEAYALLTKFIEEIKKEINTKGEFNLSNIGKFKKIGEKIHFYPNNEELFYLDSFGLPSIELKEFNNIQTDSITYKNNFENKSVVDKKLPEFKPTNFNINKKKFSLFWIFVVILLIIIVISLVIILYNLKNTKILDEIIIRTQKSSIYKNEISVTEKKTEFQNHENLIKNSDTTYYIVAGSYRYLKYAEELYHELKNKGLNPSIILTDGKIYRVIVDKFTNKEDAIKKSKILQQNTLYHIWILSTTNNPTVIKQP